MSRKTPTDWERKTISEIVGRITSGGTPKVGTSEYYNGDIPFLKINDLTRVSKFVCSSDEHITQKAVDETSAKIFPAGTVVTTMYGTIGITRILAKPMATNQAIAAFLDLRGVLPDFLHHKISHETPKLISKSAQTTQANISATLLKEHEIELPPLKEQQTIAEILTSVDEVIENTQSQINKLEDLKKATMNELLTKSIGHTEFKETEIGKIPKSWEVCTLESVCIVITKGTTPTTEGQTYVDSGVAFVKAESITTNETIDMSKLSHISPKTHALLNRSQLKKSDVLITIAGALGRVAVVEEILLPANTNQAVAIIRPIHEKISSHYLKFFLKSLYVMQEIERLKTVGAQPNLSLAQIGNLKIPILTLEEQKTIVARCEAFANRITVANEKLSNLRTLKSSLMQDLLTGKVRVTVN